LVGSAEDAYRCFINSQIDVLAVGPCYLERERQPHAALPRSFEVIPD
jgi:hypothetical protein